LWFKHPSVNNNVPHQYLNIDEEEGLLFNISRGSVHLEIGKDAIEFSTSDRSSKNSLNYSQL